MWPGFDDWLLSLDWSSGEWSHHNQPGQSRMTLNLTPAASILIGCHDHHANNAVTTETEVSKFNGQTENVSKVLASYHFSSIMDVLPLIVQLN